MSTTVRPRLLSWAPHFRGHFPWPSHSYTLPTCELSKELRGRLTMIPHCPLQAMLLVLGTLEFLPKWLQSAFMACRVSSPAGLPVAMAEFITGIQSPNFQKVDQELLFALRWKCRKSLDMQAGLPRHVHKTPHSAGLSWEEKKVISLDPGAPICLYSCFRTLIYWNIPATMEQVLKSE